jgi:hypothetical protein
MLVGQTRFGPLCLVLAIALAGLAALAPRTTLAITVSDCSDLTALRTILEGGGTIDLDCGVVTLDFGSELLIDSDTTIDGLEQTTFSGDDTHRVFRIHGNAAGVAVMLRGLTISDGFTTGDLEDGRGGGVLVDAAGGMQVTLQLEETNFSGNTADGGGAVHSGGAGGSSTLVITDATFSGNTAGAAGAVYNDGVGSNATMTITQSSFSNNTAVDGGGAIISSGINGSAALTVSHSTFSNNSATDAAGAILNWGEFGVGTLTLSNTTFSGNASPLGGAVVNYARDGTAEVTATHTTFSGNSSTFGAVLYNELNDTGTATVHLTASILANSTGQHCAGTGAALTSSDGFNLADNVDNSCALLGPNDQVVASAGLAALADNGGPTQTHALLATSPANDAAACFAATDQRGVDRPQDGNLDGIAACDSGAYELDSAEVEAPLIGSLSPDSAEANGPELQLRIFSAGTVFDFDLETVVLWDDEVLLPFNMTTDYVDVIVPAWLLTADEEFAGVITVAVRVRHGGITSNALPFTIIGDGVGAFDSAAANPFATAYVTTAPTTFGGAGLSATLQQGAGSATLTAANYTSNPTGSTLSDAIAFLDLQYRVLPPNPIQPESSIAADFYLPPNPVHGVCLPSDPYRLYYWSGAAWLDVLSSGEAAPAIDLTEDLDGTRSCGRISVTFDLSSSPSLAGLGGTVFAIVQEAAPPDTTPPTLHLPDDIVVDATGPDGAAVTYAVSASDDVTATPLVECAPLSGATFPIGVTTVECTATDDAGNAANGSFQVRVRGAAEQLAALIADVAALEMHPTLRRNLLAFLETAQSALEAGQQTDACRALGKFIQRVAAYDAHWISAVESAELRADAERIRAVVGC